MPVDTKYVRMSPIDPFQLAAHVAAEIYLNPGSPNDGVFVHAWRVDGGYYDWKSGFCYIDLFNFRNYKMGHLKIYQTRMAQLIQYQLSKELDLLDLPPCEEPCPS